MTRRRRSEVAGVVSTLAGAVLMAALWAIVILAWVAASDMAATRSRSPGDVGASGVGVGAVGTAAGRRRRKLGPVLFGELGEAARLLASSVGPVGPRAGEGRCVGCGADPALHESHTDAAGARWCLPCLGRKRQADAREAVKASARRNPWQVSDAAIAAASKARRARWQVEGATCPLCGEGRRCKCSARELAVFEARQGRLPGLGSTGPVMPAAPAAQGRLF